jgi:hypothetical protein
MALVYGLPIYLAVPAQISVWLINSLIALVVANFVRVSLFSANVPSMCLSTVAAAFVIGLACLPFFLLPISHLPAIATMILLLMLLPTDKSTLARLPSLYWLAAGILVGLSALFRPNLILLSIVLIALLIQVHAHSVRAIKQCAWTVSVLIVGILIAIAPWTARNWYVLERFVPISTNGGIVFYSANGSPDASAQGVDNPLLYEQLDRDVPDEVDRDREGWRRGLANIQRDPWTFLMSFRYRLPRLLRDPLYPVAYLRDQARGASWIWRLGIFEIATVLAFWWLWLELFRNRHAIRSRLFCASQVPWPHVAFLVVFASSLPFEISPNYQHSFLPFILFIWLSALADAKRAENVGVVGH